MLAKVNHEFRYEYDNGKYLGTYIDFKDHNTGQLYYTMTQVKEEEFDIYMKSYGEDLLVQIIDAAFDGAVTNYFDFNNDFDKFKATTKIEGYTVETPMILFKVVDYAPACATCFYVNNRLIERHNQKLFMHT